MAQFIHQSARQATKKSLTMDRQPPSKVAPPLTPKEMMWSSPWLSAIADEADVLHPAALGKLLEECCGQPAHDRFRFSPPPPPPPPARGAERYQTLTWQHILSTCELSPPPAAAVVVDRGGRSIAPRGRDDGPFHGGANSVASFANRDTAPSIPTEQESDGSTVQSIDSTSPGPALIKAPDRPLASATVYDRGLMPRHESENRDHRATPASPSTHRTRDGRRSNRTPLLETSNWPPLSLTPASRAVVPPSEHGVDHRSAPALSRVAAIASVDWPALTLDGADIADGAILDATNSASMKPTPSRSGPSRSAYIPSPILKKKAAPRDESPQPETASTERDSVAIIRDSLFKYKQKRPDIDSTVLSGNVRYTDVVQAHAKAGSPDKAEEGLRRMILEYLGGRNSFEPNHRCFTRVLVAYRRSNHPHAPERCARLLGDMFDYADALILTRCLPDTFSVTLHCWIESGRRDIAKRVGPLFRDMKNRFLSGEVSLRPDMVSYSMTLEAYVRDMQTDAATGLLYEMIDDFLDGNSEAEPTIHHVRTIMDMYARSTAVDNVIDRAGGVVMRLRELSETGVLRIKPEELDFDLLEHIGRRRKPKSILSRPK